MRWILAVALAGFFLFHTVSGQDESKTTAKPKSPAPEVMDPSRVWNFHFEGKKRRGEFIEFLEAGESRGRTLMITHLELRVRTSTRAALIEHYQVARKKKNGGGMMWRKRLRRSELFSLGWPEATTQYMASGYGSLVGMKFDAANRPAIEITFGGGMMAVYAEGYWSR